MLGELEILKGERRKFWAVCTDNCVLLRIES
jgi:hypothetical protein